MTEPREIIPCNICGHVFLSRKGYNFHQTKPNDCIPISKKDARAHTRQICAALNTQKQVRPLIRKLALEPVQEEEEVECVNRYKALLDNIA